MVTCWEGGKFWHVSNWEVLVNIVTVINEVRENLFPWIFKWFLRKSVNGFKFSINEIIQIHRNLRSFFEKKLTEDVGRVKRGLTTKSFIGICVKRLQTFFCQLKILTKLILHWTFINSSKKHHVKGLFRLEKSNKNVWTFFKSLQDSQRKV